MARVGLYHAALAFLAMSVLLPCSTAAIAKAWGGAQPLEPMANALIAEWNKKVKPALEFGKYDPSSSSNGVAGFYNGTYLIGASSEPISADKEIATIPKITVPLAIVTYSFFVTKAAGAKPLVLNAKQSFDIISGATTSWADVPGAAAAKLTGPITRVARSTKVATTAIVQQMWLKAGAGYPAGGDTTGKPFTYDGLTFAATNGDMCTKIAGTPGSIGYSHTGGCKNKAGVAEVALKNRKNVAVSSLSWNPIVALPAKVPAPDKSWDSVDLIWTANAKAPPMVSMQYSFIKKNLKKPKVPNGAVAKAFLLFILPKAGQKASTSGFLPVPAKWWAPSYTAINNTVVV
ncbi:unnamed protein product [Closterium sp. Naga37s-1]|nr:unnamed protein product [Closterium sp. Naga37s-1]